MIIPLIKLKLEYAEIIWFPHKKSKSKWERIYRIAAMMMPDLEGLTHQKKIKEMQLTTFEERRKREDLITIYKLMKNLQERNRKIEDIEKKRRGWIFNGTQEKIAERSLNDTNEFNFPQIQILEID